MQICALLTRIQCKVSDAQVTVKACGPLVSLIVEFSSKINQCLFHFNCNRNVNKKNRNVNKKKNYPRR